MKLVGVSMDLKTLYIMIGSKIKAGDMLYQSGNEKESWKFFQRDCRLGEVRLDHLEYGFVDTYEEYSVLSQEFENEFPKAGTIQKMLMEQ